MSKSVLEKDGFRRAQQVRTLVPSVPSSKEFHIGCGLRILSVNTCPEPAGARADGRTITSLSTSRQTPVAEVFCPMSSEKSVKIDRNPQQHAAVVDGQTNYAVCPPPEGLQKNGFCHVSSDIESFFYRQVASAGFSRSQWFLLALAADQTPELKIGTKT